MDFVTTYRAGVPDPSPVGDFTVVTSGSTYQVTEDDNEVMVKKTVSGAIVVTLPASPTQQRTVVISDGKGDIDVSSNNITVIGSGGTTISGRASFVYKSAWQSARFRFNGTEWNIIA